MAQHDYVIDNGTGAAVRSDLNNALSAIVTHNSGATAPSPTYAFQLWADTTTNTLKLRNAANSAWIELRQLDGDFTSVSVDNGTAAAPSVYFNASGTDTGMYSSGVDAVDFSTAGTRRLGIASGGDLTVYGGNVTLNTQGNLRFADADSSNWVAFKSPATVATNVTWTLPSVDGTNGQALTTNGTGTLSWTSPASTTDNITAGNTNATVVDTGSDGRFIVTTEGTERLRIDSSGRCGIGTTSPASIVEINAQSPTLSITSQPGFGSSIEFKQSGTAYGRVRFDGTNFDIGNLYSAGATIIYAGNAERARIDSIGRLLVGTSTPRSNVFRSGTTGITPFMQIETSTNSYSNGLSIINNSASGFGAMLSIGTSNANGIGSNTLNPSGGQIGTIQFISNDGTNFIDAASIKAEVDGTSGTNDMPTRLLFSVTADGSASPTEALRISNNRNVRFGTAGTSYGIFDINNDGTSTYKLDYVSSGGNRLFAVQASNGTVVNSTGTYTTTSDIKLKENVVNANSQWQDIKSIRIVNYNYKAETGYEQHKQIGVIAQELEQVSPGLVFDIPDTNKDGAELETSTKGVKQSILYMKAIKALQEAMERIEQLEAKVAALEAS